MLTFDFNGVDMTSHTMGIGVDIGGTKIKVARVSSAGQLIEERLLVTDADRGPAAVIADVIATVGELDTSASIPIGVGVAGQVELDSGAVRFAPNLKWWDVPLQKNLRSALHSRISILNDVRAATYGEWIFGGGRGCEDLICLFVGTGIGGGIISQGHLLTGYNNCAGELGHMIIDPSGPLCGCGNRGCLEAWAGGVHLAAQASHLIQQDYSAGKALLKLAGGQPGDVTTKMISQAYADGDRLAEQLIERATHALILGCINIVHAFNPQRLVLGGGVIEGLPHLIQEIESGVKRQALAAAVDGLEIVGAQLHNNAGVIGAAAYASHTHAEKPIES